MTLMEQEYRSRLTKIQSLTPGQDWLQRMISLLMNTRCLDEQTAREGAQLAMAWLDEYEAIKHTHESAIWSHEFQPLLKRRGVSVKDAIDASFATVVAGADFISRGSNGAPLQSVIEAAKFAFCEGFDAPNHVVRVLLTEEA